MLTQLRENSWLLDFINLQKGKHITNHYSTGSFKLTKDNGKFCDKNLPILLPSSLTVRGIKAFSSRFGSVLKSWDD